MTRDISISRAKPAMRLTMVSPPIVPVDLSRFMRWPRAASGFGRRPVGLAAPPPGRCRRRLAACCAWSLLAI